MKHRLAALQTLFPDEQYTARLQRAPLLTVHFNVAEMALWTPPTAVAVVTGGEHNHFITTIPQGLRCDCADALYHLQMVQLGKVRFKLCAHLAAYLIHPETPNSPLPERLALQHWPAYLKLAYGIELTESQLLRVVEEWGE